MKRIIGLYNSLSLSLFGFPKKEEMLVFPQAFIMPYFSAIPPSENKRTGTRFWQELARQLSINSTSGIEIYQQAIPGVRTVNGQPSFNTLWPAKITDQGNWLVRSHDIFLHGLSRRYRQKSWLPGLEFIDSGSRCEVSGFRRRQGSRLCFPDIIW